MMARRKERPARWLEYMRLDEIGRNPDNAKTHDMEMVGASAERFGIIDILTLDERTGWLVAGHGRLAALERQAAALEPPPEGIEVADDGTWMVPVSRGWASADDTEALAAGIALNAYVDRGGWDRKGLMGVLDGLNDRSSLDGIGFDTADLLALRKDLAGEEWDPDRRGNAAARREDSIDELAENYRNKNVRTLVFDYPLGEFTETAELAKRAVKRHGVPGNAELLMALLRRWDRAHPAPA